MLNKCEHRKIIEYYIPEIKCSIKILNPIAINTIPPITSANRSSLSTWDKIEPNFTPIKDNIKVIMPINIAGNII